jgi:hypothetical protein
VFTRGKLELSLSLEWRQIMMLAETIPPQVVEQGMATIKLVALVGAVT